VGNPHPTLGAVTLHCYIPPPKMARVWLASKGTKPEDSMTVPTCLYSAFGKRLAEGSGNANGQGQPTIMAPVPAPAPMAAAAPGAGEVVGSPPDREPFVGPEKLAA
jgi:hypothetical protein